MTELSNQDLTPEKRHDIFNLRINTMLDEINKFLVNESNEQYSPEYTGISKHPSNEKIAKWQKQVDALDKFFKNDISIGYIFYKLYLCQALIYYLNSDNENALRFFEGAMDFERYDAVLYYLGIVGKLGGKTPKINRKERPDNIYSLEQAMTNDKGKIPFYKHLTVGLPYAVKSHFSEWTSEEIDRYVFLRSIEWLALPAFVAMGVGALLLLVIPPLVLIIGLIAVNFIWSLFATRTVGLSVSEFCVYLNKLKWLTIPVVTVVMLVRHSYGLAIIALLWAFIGLLISLIRVNDRKGIIAHKLRQQIFLKTR